MWLSLGGNTPGSSAAIAKAVEELRRVIGCLRVSAEYRTPDISGAGPEYVNAVAAGDYGGELSELEHTCKEIETRLGRRRDVRDENGAKVVVIDIDVVVSGSDVVRPRDFARDYFTRGYEQLGGMV